MKKLVIYILLFLSFIFIGINRVNAALACGVPISENPAVNAQFNAAVTVCTDPVFDHYNVINTGSSYPNVKSYAYEMVGVTWTNTDAKSFSSGYVPRCDDVLTMMDADMEMYVYSYGQYTYGTKLVPDDICTNQSYDTCSANDYYCNWYSGGYCREKVHVPGYSCVGGTASTCGISSTMKHCEWVPMGYCYQDANHPHYKEVEDTSVKTGYTCPAGTEKDPESGALSRICRAKQKRHYTNECINPNYGYWNGECKKGPKSKQDELIGKTPKEVMGVYNLACETAYEQSKTAKPCKAISMNYNLYCPVYRCTVKDKLISTCTPSFSVGGSPAYCVNPGNTIGSSYREDTSFDVTSCKNSFNTVDCGYGNILIESRYYGTNTISEKATELAMRLWGAHTGQDGFDGSVGLSLANGASCLEGIWYLPKNGAFQNVYKRTEEFIMNDFFEYVHADINGYLDPINIDNKFEISCPGTPGDVVNPYSKYSVACGGNKEYQKAIALFFNTLLGNSKMKEHLISVNRGNIPHEPTYAELEYNDSTKKTEVVVWFEEEEYEEVFTEIRTDEIDCKCLKSKTGDCKDKYDKYQEYYNKIAPYCMTEVVFYDDKGEIPSTDSRRMEKCYKGNGCVSAKKFSGNIECDTTTTTRIPTKIKTLYKKSTITESIVKYIACGANKANQMLYSFKNSAIDSSGSQTYEYEKLPTKEQGEKIFEIDFYCHGEGTCSDVDSKVKKNINSSCKSDLSYNGVYKSSIKDPSLKCILNMGKNSSKFNYDYSDKFHVNTDFCRIYCSDEIEYSLADKVKETSSRNFKYDIRSNSEKPLSSIVKQKRTCVSDIYYHDLRESVASLRKRYNLSSNDLPTIVKGNPPAGIDKIPCGKDNKETCRPVNFFDLAVALLTKSHQEENSRGENINQIVYDLYNCNLFASSNNNFGQVSSGDSAPGNIIKKPDDNKYGNVRKYIEKVFSAPAPSSKNISGYAYGIDLEGSNCEIDLDKDGKITKNTCIEHSDMTYDFAPEVDAKSGIKMGTISKAKTTINNIKYCGVNKGKCFEYKQNDSNAYKYGNGTTTNQVNKSDYEFANLRGINFSKVNIPTNDYAYFDIEVEVGFYNDDIFTVEPDTGRVYKGTSNSYLINEAYTYPTDKLSYNIVDERGQKVCKSLTTGATDANNINAEGLSASEIEDFNKEYRRCAINQTFGKVSTFFRKQFSDEFKKTVNSSRTFTCYVDVLQPMYEKYYRNVDPSDLHPEGVPVGANWATSIGQNAEITIENNAQGIGIDKNLIDYSIILTPEQINALKDYNKKAGTQKYVNDPMDKTSCQCASDSIEKLTDEECRRRNDAYYINCDSVFLSEIRKNSEEYGTMRIDKKHKIEKD